MGLNKKNILFISKYAITPSYGNPSRQFFLCKYFAKKGFHVDLLSSQSAKLNKNDLIVGLFNKEKIDDVQHYLLKGPKIDLGFSLKRIYSWLIFEINILKLTRTKKEIKKPDVIIVSSLSILTFLTGVYLKRKYKTKLIIEVRDIWPLTLIEVGGYSKKNPIVYFLGLIEKRGYKNADAIVGTMPNISAHIKDRVKEFDLNKVFHVPQGYESQAEVKGMSELSKTFIENELLIEKEKFNIIYAGTIGKANKIDVLINTAKVLQSNEQIKFYIMGDGPLKEKYILENSNLQNVKFLDSIPSSEVFIFLKKFDLLMFMVDDSPIYRFGISFNKSIDYMRSGVPFIYSFNGYPSLFDEEKYCFKTNDNINEIASKIIEISGVDKNILYLMGRNGFEVAEKHHTFDVLSDKYIQIFKSIGVFEIK